MTEAEQIMKRCQAGTRNYEEANNLHAACYGMIGKLLAQQEKDYERGFVDGMQKQMQSSVDKAVNRMAQPEQEPSNRTTPYSTTLSSLLNSPAHQNAMAQPEQEPVADDFFKMIADRNPKPFPPPQRTWTTLTEEELHEICNSLDYYGDRGLVQLIEAKLKEKNT